MRKTDFRKTYRSSGYWTETEARRALAHVAESGLTVHAFAAREGLDVRRLTRWQRRLTASAVTAFEEVAPRVVASASALSAGERFELVLRTGRVVRVPASFDAEALRRIVAVAEEATS